MKDIFVTRSSMPPYEEYIEAIRPLWDSHWLTNMGIYHQQLERKLAEYLGVPEISLMVNGHMALELTIQAYDFPEGAEVITTPFTFISTTHAIVRNRLKPIFCDVKESDGTIDENKIEELITPKTVAIVPVHVYGHICNVDAIQAIADKYGLKVIYDAAHAFGETMKTEDENENMKETGIGNFGDTSVFSFHATKVFNTIEGGAVVCKNHELYEKLYNLKNFGIRGEELVVSVGANAKMNEFSAIMGLCNLNHIDVAIKSREQVWQKYKEALPEIKGIYLYVAGDDTKRNYGYFPIKVMPDYPLSRDELYDKLAANGIHARKYFYPLTADQACFKNKYRNADIPIARRLAGQTLVLPIYEGLGNEDIKRIIGIIRNNKD